MKVKILAALLLAAGASDCFAEKSEKEGGGSGAVPAAASAATKASSASAGASASGSEDKGYGMGAAAVPNAPFHPAGTGFEEREGGAFRSLRHAQAASEVQAPNSGEGGQEGNYEPENNRWSGQGQGPGGDQGGSEAPAGSMSLGDARFNFPTVIESFLAGRGDQGYSVTDKKTGQKRRLRLESVDEESIADASAGRYKGLVRFRDRAGAPVTLEMTVDFSTDHWAVSSVKPAAPAAPRRRPYSDQ